MSCSEALAVILSHLCGMREAAQHLKNTLHSAAQNKMQEYKGQGIVLQGDTNNNNLFKVRSSGPSFPHLCSPDTSFGAMSS